MERSKNFVKALQELKNLRPQLYSASEYCELEVLPPQRAEANDQPSTRHLSSFSSVDNPRG